MSAAPRPPNDHSGRRRTLQDAVLSSANYAIISTDQSGMVTLFNATAERWLGYTAAEIVGKTTPAIWHDAGEAVARAKVLSVELGREIEAGFEAFVAKAQLGQVDENEWTLIRKDGSRFPVTLSATALTDEAGQFTGFLGVIADITERKRVSAALQEAQRFLLSALDALSAQIAILDEHGTIIQLNAAWNRFAQENGCAAGFSNIGDNYLQVCDSAGSFSEGASLLGRGIRLVMAGISQQFEAEYACHSPTAKRWFVVRVTRFGGDGPVRVVVAHENITVPKLAEAALQRSEEILRQQQAELRLLFDFIPAMVCYKDTKNGFLRVNQRLAEPLGKTIAEIEGKSAEEIFPQEAAKYYADDLEVIQSGRPKLGIFESFQDRAKQAVWLRTDKVPVRDSTGAIIGLIVMCQDITQSRRIEDALRASEERFRLIVEGVKDYAILMLDPEGRVASWNAGAERIKGYRAEEIIGQHFTKFYPPEALAEGKPARELAEALATGQIKDEGWRVRKDGSRFFANVLITAIRDDDGRLLGFGKVTRDITEWRQAQLSLKQMAAIVASSDDAIIGKDLQGTIVSWNQGAEKIFGYEADEMVGQSIMRLIPISRQDEEIHILNRLKQGMVMKHFETVRLRRDGKLIDVSVTASPIKDSAGMVVGVSKVARDITDRKRAAARLADNEALLRQFIRHAPAAIAMLDKEMRYIQASDRWLLDYRLTGQDIIGKSHCEIFPEIAGRWSVIHQRVLAGAVERCDEDQFVRADGAVEWLQWEARPWHKADGEIGGLIFFTLTITARKLAEDKVAESLREKEALLREIHHRVKNNMQVISSILQLHTRYIKDPFLLDIFKDCQGRIRTMALIHEKLYRSEGLGQLDFKEYVESLTDLLLRSQTPKGVTVRSELQIAPITVDVDTAVPLGLIANELICNCLKHAFTGRAAGLVRVTLRKLAPGGFQLAVQDDGHGLPAGFDPAKTSSLGVRLVKILCGQIDAQLEFNSHNGAEFLVTFDLNQHKK